MPILSIENPEDVLSPGGLYIEPRLPLELQGTPFRYSLPKFNLFSCCEALGYQLAGRLGVPVMPAVPIWCPHAFRFNREMVGEGRIGLAIQYSKQFDHVTWERAASQNPQAVAASLVLCLLDRFEWGQFAATEIGLVFYDLERLFPAFRSEREEGETWEGVADDLRDSADEYATVGPSLLPEVIDEATRLRLAEPFRAAVRDAARIPKAEFMSLFDLEAHPIASQIQAIAADTAVIQFKNAARLLGV